MVLFGVFVPGEDRDREEVHALRRKYAVSVWITSLLIGAISVGFRQALGIDGTEIFLLLFTALPVLGSLIYLKFRGNAIRLKRDLNWQAPANTKRVASLSFPRKKSTIGNVWFAVPLLIVVLSAAGAAMNWDAIPSVIITHYNANGIADGFSDKGWGSVFLFNFIQLGILALFFAINYSIRSSKQSLDPKAPEQSMNSQLRIRKIMSLSLFGLSTFLIVFWGIVQGSFLYDWPKSAIISSAIALPAILLVAIVAFALYLRRHKLDEHTDPIIQQDSYWKAGAFYYNPRDPSLFVTKRTGFGWTMNYGRPLSWIITIGILAIPSIVLIFGATSIR
jgi:uncharacterized membrane protein